MERGDGGPELIDHCVEISPLSSSSTMQLSYCGHNDLCGDMVDHGNDVITRSSVRWCCKHLQITTLTYRLGYGRCSSKHISNNNN